MCLINFQNGAGAGTGSLAGSAVPEPSGLLIMTLALGSCCVTFRGSETADDPASGISVSESQSVAMAHAASPHHLDVLSYSRASILSCCALLAFAVALAPLVSLGSRAPVAAGPNRSVAQRADYLSDARLA